MRLAVKKLLAFDFAEDKEFRILQHLHGDAKFPSLGVDRFKHLIAEMYSATKEVGAENRARNPWYCASSITPWPYSAFLLLHT